MAGYFKKRSVKKALEKAKVLEQEPEPIPTREKEAELVKESITLSERLKGMLKPEWFVKDVHKPHTQCRQCKKRKPAKKASRAGSATKKKK